MLREELLPSYCATQYRRRFETKQATRLDEDVMKLRKKLNDIEKIESKLAKGEAVHFFWSFWLP